MSAIWKYLETGIVKHRFNKRDSLVSLCFIDQTDFPQSWKDDNEGLWKRRSCRTCNKNNLEG